MKEILKDRYLWGIVVLFLGWITYSYFQDSGKVSWIPSDANFPLTDTVVDLVLFFSFVTLGAFRFQIRGGIIASIVGLPVLIACHINILAKTDVWVEILFSEVSGLIIAFIWGSYVASANKLQKAFNDIKTLSGLLPICASCKKIRHDNGYWQAVEGYIQEHTAAEFTHSICPECLTKLYPDLYPAINPGAISPKDN